jgi:hypothetical protein
VTRLSERSQRIRAGFSNVVRNTFEVRQSRGRGIGAIVASLGLKPRNAARAETAIAALDMQVPQLMRRHGVVGVHWLQAVPDVRARMDAVRATGQSDANIDYVLLIEATRMTELQDIRCSELSTTALEHLDWAEQAFGIYNLMYEVSELNKGVDTLLGNRI